MDGVCGHIGFIRSNLFCAALGPLVIYIAVGRIYRAAFRRRRHEPVQSFVRWRNRLLQQRAAAADDFCALSVYGTSGGRKFVIFMASFVFIIDVA